MKPGTAEEPVQIGRYHVRGRLGQGGFATVYRAWDPMLRREVALKVLLPELAGDAGLRARFLAEARVLAGLRHPAIAVVHDVGETEGLPFFAMELIDGRTLAQATIGGRSLPLGDVITIAERLCAAVDAMHAAGVLHRDIKASNVMVDGDGRVVLMDFGIARTEDSVETTRADGILGTPVAMAPEQVRGDPCGPAADVYAIGVLVYHLLAGQPPFTGDAVRVLHAHAYEPPPPLRLLRPGLPERVYAAVESALAKEPGRRPAPARALAASLAGGDPSVPARPPASRPDHRPAIRPSHRRGRFPSGGVTRAAALVSATVLFALLLVFLLSRTDRADVRQAAVLDGETPDGGTPMMARPEVDGLKVYDNVFSARELSFPVGDSVAACFTLLPGGDPQPLVVVATSTEQPPADPAAASVVARSDSVPNEASEACHTVSVLAQPLPAGAYWVWVLHGGEALAGRGFIAQARPGGILVADNFDDPTRGILPQGSPDPEHFAVAYVDGAYAITKRDPAFAGVPYVRIPGNFENVSVAFDVRVIGPAVDRYVTLGCRTSSPALDNGYRFSLETDRGRFLLDRWDGGVLTTLASGSSLAVRRDGQPNRIELTCAGETIAVSVNGTRVAAVQDGNHRSGLLWIGVESDPARRHSIEARFDNLVVVQQ